MEGGRKGGVARKVAEPLLIEIGGPRIARGGLRIETAYRDKLLSDREELLLDARIHGVAATACGNGLSS